MINIPPQKPAGSPKTFACPSCGGAVTVKAVGHTIQAICSFCSSVIDVTDENYRIIRRAQQKIRPTLLDIGTRGTLRGIMWEVIGYMEKSDGSGDYRWDEYLLYNPYHGFRFLVQANGHWNLMTVQKRDIDGLGWKEKVKLNGRKYKLFLKGVANVEYVKGEFYWHAKKGEQVNCADYIAPPYMLSMEKSDQELTVSSGEYLKPSEVCDAFDVAKDNMPMKDGIAPNQPAPFQGRLSKIWAVTLAAFIGVLTIQAITSSHADNATVGNAQFTVSPAQKTETLSTNSFILPKQGNVVIWSSSPVQNDWVELELSLVNEQTNETYDTRQAIEYYLGSDSDGPWKEGSQYAKTTISRVPPGNYRLLIDVDAGAWQKNQDVPVGVSIKRDVPDLSNFWITVLLLVIYPFFALWRRRSFESSRWQESEYAPYIYQQSN